MAAARAGKGTRARGRWRQLLVFVALAATRARGSWERYLTLKDTSDFFTLNKPADGWHVTPVHQHLLPDGTVLVNAWIREGEFDCKRNVAYGGSFVLDPRTMVGKGPRGVIEVDMLDEKPKRKDKTYFDTATFSGHATLPDSRKLFFGGSRFNMMSRNWGIGLDYVHLFDPATKTYETVAEPCPFGLAWYPTVTMLPDQRLMIFAGFSTSNVASNAMATFDFQRFRNGRSSPWQLLFRDEEPGSGEDIVPAKADYTRIFVLPEPVQLGGLERQLVFFGQGARMRFYNSDEYRAVEDRWATPPNDARANRCGSATTSAILATGELLVAGGCNTSTFDLYDPREDTWASIETGIVREYANAVLLPDGSVLVIHGENEIIDQDTGEDFGFGDPRTPLLFDPFSRHLTPLDQEPSDGTNHPDQGAFRGYHSTATLLHDGRVLVGGGRHAEGFTTCEQPNIRLFNPPFLDAARLRPEVASLDNGDGSSAGLPELRLDDQSSFLVLRRSDALPLLPSSDAPRSRSGAVLIAFGSGTHSYDQAQRFVPLRYEQDTADPAVLRVYAPGSPQGIPGDYMLFLVAADGTPSVARNVRLTPARGSWLRTVIYVQHGALAPGHSLQLVGGHSASVAAAHYGGQEEEPLQHMNLVGANAVNANHKALSWQGPGARLAWTASRAARPDLFDDGILYARHGTGVDPENNYGEDWFKFEAFMHQDTGATSAAFRDWFEFSLRVVDASGAAVEAEAETLVHKGPAGQSPPAQTGVHWARKGHATAVVFGQGEAVDVYDLNEDAVRGVRLGLPETDAPTSTPSAAPTRSPSATPSATPSMHPSSSPTASPEVPTAAPSLTSWPGAVNGGAPDAEARQGKLGAVGGAAAGVCGALALAAVLHGIRRRVASREGGSRVNAVRGGSKGRTDWDTVACSDIEGDCAVVSEADATSEADTATFCAGGNEADDTEFAGNHGEGDGFSGLGEGPEVVSALGEGSEAISGEAGGPDEAPEP